MPLPVSATEYEYGDPAACKPSAAVPYESFMGSISASFPLGMKTLLGLALSDSDLSERCVLSVIRTNEDTCLIILSLFVQAMIVAFMSFPLKDLFNRMHIVVCSTRRLDAWLRDLCYNYRTLPAGAKQLVRDFLQFDMSRSMDIFIQDQLAWGLIGLCLSLYLIVAYYAAVSMANIYSTSDYPMLCDCNHKR